MNNYTQTYDSFSFGRYNYLEHLKSLERLQSNVSSSETRNAKVWSSNTATTADGKRVFMATACSLGPTFDKLITKNPYENYIIDEFSYIFQPSVFSQEASSNSAQILKNQDAISLLKSWKKRDEDEINITLEKVKLEIEEEALSSRRRFQD